MRTKLKPAHAGVALALAATGMATLAACGGASSGAASDAKSVSVVGFSVLQTANAKVFHDFEHTSAGKGVQFTTSYGASGDQSRAVAAGLKADEVHLSLEPDVTRLVEAGMVPTNWAPAPTKGMLTHRWWCWWSARATPSTSPAGTT